MPGYISTIGEKRMAIYAIAHAPKGASFIVTGESDSPVCTRLTDDPASPQKARAKTSFLDGTLQPGDIVLLELGGPADRLALAAHAYGAEVLRYPSFLLNKERCAEIAELCDYKVRGEKPRDNETGEALTARKMRAYALFGLNAVGESGFYRTEPKDVDMMRLGLAWRSYQRSYKATMRSYQGILAAYRDQVWLELALTRQHKAEELEETVYDRVLEMLVEDILGGEISETERKDFFALIGKEFEGGRFPDRADEKVIAKLVELLFESDRFKATVFDRLKSQKKRIEKMLTGSKRPMVEPNAIYQKVFEPIPGCGPLIAARFISAISDIRRFETRAKLTAYAGYHHFEDGTRARRRSGSVSNWNMELKQATYLLCDMTVKNAASPWRAMLDRRKAYELVKILRDRQHQADVMDLDTMRLLPESFAEREINSFLDVEVADFERLSKHIEALRELAGVAWKGDETDESEEEPEAHGKTDKELGKLVRGVKGLAHQKGLRWLGQQFLKHIYREWRKAVGIHDEPRLPAPSGDVAPSAETSKQRDGSSMVRHAPPPAE